MTDERRLRKRAVEAEHEARVKAYNEIYGVPAPPPPESAPLCTCHGERMTWKRNVRKTVGGGWRCPRRHSEQMLAWFYGTDKGRAALRRNTLRQSTRARAVRIAQAKETMNHRPL